MTTTRLGSMLLLYRAANRLGVREIGRAIGISPATVSRIERGLGYDMATHLKLLVWMTARDA